MAAREHNRGAPLYLFAAWAVRTEWECSKVSKHPPTEYRCLMPRRAKRKRHKPTWRKQHINGTVAGAGEFSLNGISIKIWTYFP